MKQEQVLVVDDLKDGQHIRDYLRAQGVAADWVQDCNAVREYLAQHKVDVVVLDVMLPDGNGLSLVKELRLHHYRMPIIMISAERIEETDRVVGLDLGADDYLVKPVLLRELYAKIRAVSRRYNQLAENNAVEQGLLPFGPYRLNLTLRCLSRGNREVKITDAEFNLLKILLTHAYTILDRNQLAQLLSGDHHTEDRRTIDVRISRLRRRIEPDPERPSYIRTVRRKGYLFTPDGEPSRDAKVGEKKLRNVKKTRTAKKKTVLVIGGGGREHALAWKLSSSTSVKTVFVAPGNAGTALEKNIVNVDIAADDLPALLRFAKEKNITMTIVGPEAPLVAGLVDSFQAVGLPCFGPSSEAAQLEGSKAFSKDFLKRHHIPTADYQVFSEIEAAHAYIRQQGAPIVVKADGLAAGKGVILAYNEAEAYQAVSDMLAGNAFGEAGHRVVIEEFLQGEEASFICMVDGEHILPMATSQDHKARDAGDAGPNTGGMGAYSPAPVVTPDLHQRIMREVIEPTVQGMAGDGIPYTGFLYAGLMIGADGVPKVLEFNCRFGDPETQPIMMRLKSDLLELCEAALDKRLHKVKAEWHEQVALGVVLAAGGYPDHYEKGKVIHLPEIKGTSKKYKIFHAGTTQKDDAVVTNGGRVLCACALGNSISDAKQKAYRLVRQISWENMYFRTDIGYRAVARERAQKRAEKKVGMEMA